MKQENDINKVMLIKAPLFENDNMWSIYPTTKNAGLARFLLFV